ncbi:MAG: peptidoglycan DD-metalloendopeptidase family protein [Proteobacteria bacterium]|nr:peptidoglycan DD-metalloendopeptidase family protein [Pseudomonadota bacterium]
MTEVPQTVAARRWRRAGLLVLMLLLAACGRDRDVREQSAYRPPQRVNAPHRAGADDVVVVRGDTLYGIAFRNGMDFRELAALNGIGPPYTIFVGQTLRLRGGHARPAMPATPAPTRQPPTATAQAPPYHPPPLRRMPPHSQPPPTAEAVPGGASVQVPATQTVPQTAPQSVPTPTPSAAILPADVATVGGMRWRWPAAGALLGRYVPGDATRQGIDIAGHAGDPVVAAADGVVVYSGSGLVGYGELVIIKHSDEWLSAYGHNRKRLVVEGQRVRAGQPIAEMGSSGAPRDELHFEIRRNGRPVDPLAYLPGR